MKAWILHGILLASLILNPAMLPKAQADEEYWTYDHTEYTLHASLSAAGGSQGVPANETREISLSAHVTYYEVWTSNLGGMESRNPGSLMADPVTTNWAVASGNGMLNGGSANYTTFQMGTSESTVVADVSHYNTTYGFSVSTSASITFTPPPVTYSFEHVSPAQEFLYPGNSTMVQARLMRTQNGESQPAASATVNFSATGDGALGATQGTTDYDGYVSVPFTMGSQNASVLFQTTGGLLNSNNQEASIGFSIELPPEEYYYFDQVSPSDTTTLDPGNTATIQGRLMYYHSSTGSSVVQNAWVYFDVLGGDGTVDPTMVQTGTDGTVSTTYTQGTGGTQIRMRAPGYLGADAQDAYYDFDFQPPPPPSHYFFAAVSPQTGSTVLNPDTSTTLEALLYYYDSTTGETNQVSGATVNFTVEEGTGWVDPGTGQTDGTGLVGTTFGLGGGTCVVRFTAPGYMAYDQNSDASLEFVIFQAEPSYYYLEYLTSTPVDTEVGTPVTLSARLMYRDGLLQTSTPVENASVIFSVTSGDAYLSTSNVTTGADGICTTDVTLNSESAVVRFETSGGYPGLDGNEASLEFAVQDPPPAYYYFTGGGSFSVSPGQSQALTTQLMYFDGTTSTPVAGETVYFSLSGLAGSLSPAGSTQTAGDGTCTTTYTHSSGSGTVQFYVPTLQDESGQTVSVLFHINPPPSYYYFNPAQTTISVSDWGTQTLTTQLMYNDGYDSSPVSGAWVDFAIQLGNGSLSDTGASSDGDGYVSVTYYHGEGPAMIGFTASGYADLSGGDAKASFSINAENSGYFFTPAASSLELAPDDTTTLNTQLVYSDGAQFSFVEAGQAVEYVVTRPGGGTESGTVYTGGQGQVSVPYTHQSGTNTVLLTASGLYAPGGGDAQAQFTINDSIQTYYYFNPGQTWLDLAPGGETTLQTQLRLHDVGTGEDTHVPETGPITVTVYQQNGSYEQVATLTSDINGNVSIPYTHTSGSVTVRFEYEGGGSSDFYIQEASYYFFSPDKVAVQVGTGSSAVLQTTLYFHDGQTGQDAPVPWTGDVLYYNMMSGSGHVDFNYGGTNENGVASTTYYHPNEGGLNTLRFEAPSHPGPDGQPATAMFSMHQFGPHYVFSPSEGSSQIPPGTNSSVGSWLYSFDGYGYSPAAGVEVNFAAGGSMSVGNSTGTTDSNGYVSTTFAYGSSSGSVQFQTTGGRYGPDGQEARAQFSYTDQPVPYYYFTNPSGPSTLARGEGGNFTAQVYYYDAGSGSSFYVTDVSTYYTHGGGTATVTLEGSGYMNSSGQPIVQSFTVMDAGRYEFTPSSSSFEVGPGGMVAMSAQLSYSSSYTGTYWLASQPVTVNVTAGGGSVSTAPFVTDWEGRVSATYTHGSGAGGVQFTLPDGYLDSSNQPARATFTTYEPPPSYYYFNNATPLNSILLPGDTVTLTADLFYHDGPMGTSYPQYGNGPVSISIVSGGGTLSSTSVHADSSTAAVSVGYTRTGDPNPTVVRFSYQGAVQEFTITSSPYYYFGPDYSEDSLSPNGSATLSAQLMYFNGSTSEPVADAPVSIFLSGSGNLSTWSTTTGQGGQASVTYTHGNGTSTITFTAYGYPGSGGQPATSTFVIQEAPPVSYYYFQDWSGQTRALYPGHQASLSPQLYYFDASNNSTSAVFGATVTCSVVSGNGTIDNTSVTTDESGYVNLTYTHAPGTSVVRLSHGGAEIDYTLNNAAPGNYFLPPHSTVALWADQTATLSTQLRYFNGASSSGAANTGPVQFEVISGSGTLTTTSGTTDANGNISVGYTHTGGGTGLVRFTQGTSQAYFSIIPPSYYFISPAQATVSLARGESTTLTATVEYYDGQTGQYQVVGQFSSYYTHTGGTVVTGVDGSGYYGPDSQPLVAQYTITDAGTYSFDPAVTTYEGQTTGTVINLEAGLSYNSSYTGPVQLEGVDVAFVMTSGNGTLDATHANTGTGGLVAVNYTHNSGTSVVEFTLPAGCLNSEGEQAVSTFNIHSPESYYHFVPDRSAVQVGAGSAAVIESILYYHNGAAGTDDVVGNSSNIQFNVISGSGQVSPALGGSNESGLVSTTYQHPAEGSITKVRFVATDYAGSDGQPATATFTLHENGPHYRFSPAETTVAVQSLSSATVQTQLQYFDGYDLVAAPGVSITGSAMGNFSLTNGPSWTDSNGVTEFTGTFYGGNATVTLETQGEYFGPDGLPARAVVHVVDVLPPPYYYLSPSTATISLARGEPATLTSEVWYYEPSTGQSSFVTQVSTSYTHSGGTQTADLVSGYSDSNGNPLVCVFTIHDSGVYAFSPPTSSMSLPDGSPVDLTAQLGYTSAYTGAVTLASVPVSFTVTSGSGSLSSSSGETDWDGYVTAGYTHGTGAGEVRFSLPPGCLDSSGQPAVAVFQFEQPPQPYWYFVESEGTTYLDQGNSINYDVVLYYFDGFNATPQDGVYVAIGGFAGDVSTAGEVTHDGGHCQVTFTYQGPDSGYVQFVAPEGYNGPSGSRAQAFFTIRKTGSHFYFSPATSSLEVEEGGSVSLSTSLLYDNGFGSTVPVNEVQVQFAVVSGSGALSSTQGNTASTGAISAGYTHGSGTTQVRFTAQGVSNQDGQPVTASFEINQAPEGWYFFDPESSTLDYNTNAVGWTEHTFSPATTARSLFSSADGSRLITGGGYWYGYGSVVYGSTDGGATWNTMELPLEASFGELAGSDDAQKLVLVDSGNIFTSTDSGATWTERATGYSWMCAASSADGTKLVAGEGLSYSGTGGVWLSADSGASWSYTNPAPGYGCRALTTSADGSFILASFYDTAGSKLLRSTDSGATWTEVVGASSANWISLDCSTNGTRVVACEAEYISGAWDVGFWVSADSGATWTQTYSGEGCAQDVSSSADGSTLVVANWHGGLGQGGELMISRDYGATWTAEPSLNGLDWVVAAISADGSKIAGGIFGGSVWTSGLSGMSLQARLLFHNPLTGLNSAVPGVAPVTLSVTSGDGALMTSSAASDSEGYVSAHYTHGAATTSVVRFEAPAAYLGENGQPASAQFVISSSP